MANTDADATYQKNITIAVPLVFAILSTLVYGVRLYARRTSAARIGVDDLLMGIGLLLSFGATAGVVSSKPHRVMTRRCLCNCLYSVAGFNGAGRPVLRLPKPERQRFNEVRLRKHRYNHRLSDLTCRDYTGKMDSPKILANLPSIYQMLHHSLHATTIQTSQTVHHRLECVNRFYRASGNGRRLDEYISVLAAAVFLQ